MVDSKFCSYDKNRVLSVVVIDVKHCRLLMSSVIDDLVVQEVANK